MKKRLLGFLGAIVLSQSLVAEPVLRDDYPERYTVVKGDTLWDISNRFLENPWKWPEIWHVNPQIANPHLIYPGDVIRMIYLDAQSILWKTNAVGTSKRALSKAWKVKRLRLRAPRADVILVGTVLTRLVLGDPSRSSEGKLATRFGHPRQQNHKAHI